MRKSIVLISFLVVGLLFAVQGSAIEDGVACGKGCRGQNSQGQQPSLDPEAKKKYDAFLQDTVELRKELAEILVEYQILMTSANPDTSKAAMLTEEFFQLRGFITEKAKQAGIVQKREGCNSCNGKAGAVCDRSGPGANVEKTN